jgi:beta-fructofuranosidase
MSLPRVLSLGPDGTLLMTVPQEIERLRYNGQKRTDLAIGADSEQLLDGLQGNSLELALEFNPTKATQFGLKVCCSPDGAEQTLVYYDAAEKKLKVDTTNSGPDTPKTVEAGPFELKAGEPLKLRVFIDKSVVEVFANDRQAVMRRVYPSRADSVGLRLFSKGGAATVSSLEAWEMMRSNAF